MLRSRFRSLRVRLGLLLAFAVAATLASGLALAWGLSVANGHVQELASAQRRLELLSGLSGRVTDYALVALQSAETQAGASGDLDRAKERVAEAFDRFGEEVATAVERLVDEEAATLIAARSRVLARLRARFDFLDQQTHAALAGAASDRDGARDRIKVALDGFAAGFGPALSQSIEEERAAAQAAQAGMSSFIASLTRAAAIAGVATLVLALVLYRAIARPLVTRVSDVAAAARAISRGAIDTRLAVRGHDELSLAMARFNRMAVQLARREARLVEGQRRLQEIVDARTAELVAANARLADIDRARRRFFTDVSHELRTPLTVILGEADVTLRAPSAEDDLRQALQVIRARARRLHRRVEDMLRVARSESGEIELEMAPVEVADLLSEAREGIESVARGRGITIGVEAPADLQVEGDWEWLRQTVEGLLANAVRHSPPGGTIALTGRREAEEAVIEVRDQGSGIAEADLPHVFERFFRGGAARPEGAGFGIGLALAKWIVERHRGRIAIARGPSGVGTVVTITLAALEAAHIDRERT